MAGSHYFIGFIDDYTRQSCIYFMKANQMLLKSFSNSSHTSNVNSMPKSRLIKSTTATNTLAKPVMNTSDLKVFAHDLHFPIAMSPTVRRNGSIVLSSQALEL